MLDMIDLRAMTVSDAKWKNAVPSIANKTKRLHTFALWYSYARQYKEDVELKNHITPCPMSTLLLLCSLGTVVIIPCFVECRNKFLHFVSYPKQTVIAKQ